MRALLSSLVIIIILLHHHYQSFAQTNTNMSSFPPTVNNEFAWNLFKNSKPSNRNAENFILNPISVQLLLSLLQLAAEGGTREQLKIVTNSVVPAQLYYILNPQGINPEIKSANGIFIDSDEKINDNVSLHIYINGGDIYKVPLQKQPTLARNSINYWAANATQGQVQQLLGEATDVSRLRALIASAVYFHSTWKFQLLPSQPRKFYTYFNEGKPAQFMEVIEYFKTTTINLGRNVGGSMISIPYKNNTYSMLLMVPGPGISLNKFLNHLNHNKVSEIIQITDNLYLSKVHLFMPKFKVSSKISLVASLQKMGLVDIFSASSSRLTKLTYAQEPLRISEVLQQTTLEVDEIGTIATSVTAAFVVPLSANEPETKVMIVDKPFIAIILETATNTPIFIAKIAKPNLTL